MRGSIILFGSTQQNRQSHACKIISKELDQKLNWNYLENFPDIKIIEPLEDKKSIGIAQTKEGIGFMQEKPLALPLKVLVIAKANIMTDEAQSTLLKILEEPPEYALMLLLSKTEGALLPTVLSRCRKIKTFVREIPEDEIQAKVDKKFTLHHMLQLSPGEKIDWAEEIAKEEKDTIIDMLESWIEEGRVLLKEIVNPKIAEDINAIVDTLADLEATNVGTRIALEKTVLNFKS